MNELDIFSAALELHSMEGRARYLDEACGDNPERRRRIDELLGSHAHAGSFMNAPGQERVAQATKDEPIAERPGTIIGPTGMSRLAPSPAEIVGHEESAAVEATDSSCGQLRALIHQSPRSLGKSRSTWTLRLLAEVCAEQGIVDHQVSPSTICRTLRRMKISWKRARRWMTSPDPDYALKKARRERLIQVASKHPLRTENQILKEKLGKRRIPP